MPPSRRRSRRAGRVPTSTSCRSIRRGRGRGGERSRQPPGRLCTRRSPYRVRTRCSCRTIRCWPAQWNLPSIDWKGVGHSAAGGLPTITVAVLDTGMAYKNATLTGKVRLSGPRMGGLYPALGPSRFRIRPPRSSCPRHPGASLPRDFIRRHGRPRSTSTGHGNTCQRDDRPVAYERRDRHGGRRVQREASMPVKVLTRVADLLFAGITISTRAASDDVVAQGIRDARPTTAPRLST